MLSFNFPPSEIGHVFTAYSDMWIRVRSGNTKTHRQQLGVEKHFLVRTLHENCSAH